MALMQPSQGAPATPNVNPLAEGAEQASPREQTMYDRLVVGADKYIYGVGGDAIEGMYESGMPPKQVVATVTAALIQKGKEELSLPAEVGDATAPPETMEVEAENEVPSDVLLHAGAAIMEIAIEHGKSTGNLSFKSEDDEEEFQAEAADIAIDAFLEQAQTRGELDSQSAADEIRQGLKLEGYELPAGAIARQDPVAEGVGEALGVPPAGPPPGAPMPGGPPPGAMPPGPPLMGGPPPDAMPPGGMPA